MSHVPPLTPLTAPSPELSRPEFIRWSLTGVIALLASYGIALLIDRLYQPDIGAALDLAAAVSIRPLEMFHPKPKAKLIFVAIVGVLPFLLAAAYPVTGRLTRNLSPGATSTLFYLVLAVTTGSLAVAGYCGLVASNPFTDPPLNAHDNIAATNLQFYFIRTFLYQYFWLYLVALFPPLLYLLVRGHALAGRGAELLRRYQRLPVYVWCGALIGCAFAINLFRFPYTYENRYDFNAVYYAMVQVYHGMPMLVDHFVNTYGLYPHFIAPFLKITGLSILTFSGCMALLIALCYTMLFRFVDRHIRNSMVAVSCFTTIIFYGHFYFKTVMNYDAIFASQPIRFLFPMLALFLAPSCLGAGRHRFRLVSLLLLAFGIFWNPEFGIMTFLSFVLFLCYAEAEKSGYVDLVKKCALQLVAAAAALLLAATLYSGTIRIAYGSFPDLLAMFNTFRMFSVIGFGMLETPLLHPWNLVALIYLVALLYVMVALLNREVTGRHALVFLLFLLGVGSLFYYQGRSHNWNLLVTSVYAFLLLGMAADALLLMARKEKGFLVPLGMIMFFLSASLFQVAYSSEALAKLVFETDNKARNASRNALLMADAEFIRENSREHDKVLILVEEYSQGVYHGLSGTASAFNPGLIDLFLRSDYDRLLVWLENNRDTRVYYDPRTFRPYDNRILALLSTRYHPGKSNGRIMLLEKNQ
jgi:hypothetical protein